MENLSKNRKVKLFKKKEIIYREDDYANNLYFITKGRVKCVKTDEYGKTFIYDIHGAGKFIGYLTLLENGEYHETAIAMENTKLSVIPKRDFLDLVFKNRDVAARFIKMLTNNVQEKEERLLQLAYAPVRERTARVLLTLKEKEQPGTIVKLNVSREDLANMVGTAKESLIRMISEFKKEGLVDTEGQKIRIINAKGIQEIISGMNEDTRMSLR